MGVAEEEGGGAVAALHPAGQSYRGRAQGKRGSRWCRAGLRVRLGNGRVIDVARGFYAELLREVVAVLEEVSRGEHA